LITTLGAGLGSIGGGALGSVIGSGTGRTVATASGALVGGAVGAYASQNLIDGNPQASTAQVQPQQQFQAQPQLSVQPQIQVQRLTSAQPQVPVQPQFTAQPQIQVQQPQFQTQAISQPSVYAAAPQNYQTISPTQVAQPVITAAPEQIYIAPVSNSAFAPAPTVSTINAQPVAPNTFGTSATTYSAPVLPTAYAPTLPSISAPTLPSVAAPTLPTVQSPSFVGTAQSISQSAIPQTAVAPYTIPSPQTTVTTPTFGGAVSTF